MACALESLARQAAIWRVSERVLSDYFLRGYRRGGGPGRVDPELRALRAIEIAWQIANGEDRVRPLSVGADRADDGGCDRWPRLGARAYAGQSGQFGWAA